jgi:hypothetical protein
MAAAYYEHCNGQLCSIKDREFIYYTIKVKGIRHEDV